MRIGICPGSFDPVTNGHVDVFERSAKLVDKLIIAIFANPGKHPLFSMEEREELLRQAVGHIPNVEVVSFQGPLNEGLPLLFAVYGPLRILNTSFSALC